MLAFVRQCTQIYVKNKTTVLAYPGSQAPRTIMSEVILFLLLKKYSLWIDIICNGNRTEWSLIRTVIIRGLINKIGRQRSGSPICLSQV